MIQQISTQQIVNIYRKLLVTGIAVIYNPIPHLQFFQNSKLASTHINYIFFKNIMKLIRCQNRAKSKFW